MPNFATNSFIMRKLFLLLTLLVAMVAQAKLSQFVLRGYVTEQDYAKSDSWQRETLDSVYVAVMRNDTIPVPFKMLTGDTENKMATGGEVRLLVEGGLGNYTLLLEKDGYETLRHPFKVASESQDVVYLRDVAMAKQRRTALKEVEVVGTAIKMVMHGDTIVYDSAAFNLPEGSSLEALVRQLPGAQIDGDGAITVGGKKVNSLLLNGNDFFKGNPDVVLKNLPAYVVSKIKVYDRADRDDYLTHRSQTLSDATPDEENIVMDVLIKREFQMATIFNIEAGYGPGIYHSSDPKRYDHRYIGRGFGVGFGKNYRFSVFGNCNNINNSSRASSYKKDWGWSWPMPGDQEIQMGGFDVFYKPHEKTEIQADMQYSEEHINTESLSASTRYFDTGNLYSRSRSISTEKRHHLIGHAKLTYSGDNFYIDIEPRVDWLRTSMTSYGYLANLDRNPEEQSRGAVIDSLFILNNPSESLRNSVTSSRYQSANGTSPSWPNTLHLSTWAYAQVSPKSWRAQLQFNANVKDEQKHSEIGNMYLTDIDPMNQWRDNDKRETSAYATVRLYWKKSWHTEKRSRTLSLTAEPQWSMDRERSNEVYLYELLKQDITPQSRPLPSVTAPEYIHPLIDGQNTLNSLFLNNRAQGLGRAVYSIEPVAPTDSGLNPSFNFYAQYQYTEHFRHLDFNKPYLDPAFLYHIDDNSGVNSASCQVVVASRNKVRATSLQLNYRFEQSLNSLYMLIPTTSSNDPFNVYLGPEGGTKFAKPYTHFAQIYWNRYSNSTQRQMYAYISANIYGNELAQAAVFDPATGITTHRPMTVNGRWNLNCNFHYYCPFAKQWKFNSDIYFHHNNNVDYVASVGTPQRSLVRNEDLDADVSFTYSIPGNGTTFTVHGFIGWQRSWSPRQGFTPIAGYEPGWSFATKFYLPWQIEGESSLRANFRRGYQDSALNTTEWIWNASVQKSLVKGKLTVKLTATDLLGQRSNISYVINAMGRTETWTNNLPRYCMLSLTWNFAHTPNSLK